MGLVLNIRNQLQYNRSSESFNILLFATWVWGNKICSTNDYTFFLRETNESLFSIYQKGIQKKKKITSEGGMRSTHSQTTKKCRKNLIYLPF